MTGPSRRNFLKASALAGASLAALPVALQRALAIPAAGRTGTIRDVEHVVILMQENRSFDHYFGTLRGVRGYGDPRTPALPGGKSVWLQPAVDHADGHIAPFHMDTRQTSAQCLESLDHSWKGSQETWKNHDAWIAAKGPMTMGHFTRDDIPFYHALADAFTICDAYHCSIFGPTNPNRLFLFTGTSGLSVGNDGLQAIQNPKEETSYFADPAHDSPGFTPFTWPTYAERLQAAGIDWRVFQEYENFGDNALSYFANFRGSGAESDIGKRARSWAPTSTMDTVRASRGEHLVADFAATVKEDRLPQVSWIVAPYITCEHPKATPGYGEALSSRLLSALASNPAVWAKTVFILNYDENDGFFDHVPPPVPPVVADRGKSTVGIAEEIYHGEPVGLGPRVPLLIISPWTRGGWVNSQLHDHTSVIRFLEARFGVAEPQISPWRRTVCGDLTSLFDFAQGDAAVYALAPADGAIATADASCKLQHPVVPQTQAIPQQETGQRPARPLPYDIRVSGTADETVFRIDIVNSGRAGATLTVYANDHSAGPWYYTVDAGKTLSDMLPLAGKEFGFSVYGPNGFLRAFHGASSSPKVVTSARYDATDGALVLKIANNADSEKTVAISALDYSPEPPRTLTIAAGATHEDRWNIASSAHWYDIAVKMPDDDTFLNRFAGHIETGKPSLSDPAFGRQRA